MATKATLPEKPMGGIHFKMTLNGVSGEIRLRKVVKEPHVNLSNYVTKNRTHKEFLESDSHSTPVWPDFCKGVKIYPFSSEIIFGQLHRHLAVFFWSHCSYLSLWEKALWLDVASQVMNHKALIWHFLMRLAFKYLLSTFLVYFCLFFASTGTIKIRSRDHPYNVLII